MFRLTIARTGLVSDDHSESLHHAGATNHAQIIIMRYYYEI